MILKALCDYYEAMLASGSDIPVAGMEFRSIKYMIVIDYDGCFIRLEDLRDEKGQGQPLAVIQGDKRTSKVFPYTLWDKSKYILGWDPNDKKGPDFPKELQVFKERIDELCTTFPDNMEFKAIQLFYQQYTGRLPQLEGVNQIKGNDWLTFKIQGSEYFHISAHPDATCLAEKDMTSTDNKGHCLVYGEELPLADLHPKVNLAGAEAQATIVSFQKNQGFDSYGKKQGENAPISTKASFAHTTALNYLLRSGAETNYRIGDITYVFWNSLLDEEINKAFKEYGFAQENSTNLDAPNPEDEAYRVRETFEGVLGIRRGRISHGTEKEEGRFYILGISPGGRIAVRFWKEGTIGDIFHNLYLHLQDMNIVTWQNEGSEERPPKRSLFRIVSQITSSDKADQWGLNLIQSIVESILNGTPYPKALQEACLGRVRLKGDVTEYRAAILKGCINRNIRSKKYNKSKELTMALDKTNTNTAYLLGRAFAILESIQQKALGTTNSSIRDRFYGSASTRPNTVFGRLIALSNHHLSKLKKEKQGLAIYFEQELQEILSKIEVKEGNPPFPAVFNLDKQSLFAVGYYQQKAYRKADDNDSDNEK
ncbi:type I-C CRISPR-associated protein Cas8c/Csd1 [Porphyromonas levii]|uniref:type I-C CRISPR-associated protein Cas8c/Csd1 n=1 Tax=Porphyromonas levii TaxID=28114 RepID=UPI001B8B4417|nr:type I-C CRISPR-associated protein Cas8c/Csd1 [Porphyromonas levii]MBR8713025.1 hypothetical protein [Porphyromonas levii]MBR8715072.1 hypothetical protein [Porphyromonas levii]MBR8727564.1 hypothetical protein [Porphyromonas levii]MBR8735933.1 hypothetical protein [Porphyromonas levii]MBR8765272.1 hypothetical protein [Porphyromonas levii]